MLFLNIREGKQQENLLLSDVPTYPHTGTCRPVWWAAACPPCRGAPCTGRFQAPCSHSSPSRRARGGDSRSTEGLLLSPWWRNTTVTSLKMERRAEGGWAEEKGGENNQTEGDDRKEEKWITMMEEVKENTRRNDSKERGKRTYTWKKLQSKKY